MVVGRLRRDIEVARSLLCRMPGCDEAQDLDLAWSQSGQSLGRIPAGGLTGAGEHRLGRLRAEPPLPDSTAQLGRGGGVAQRGPVWPCLSRSLKSLGRRQDAGRGREIARLCVSVIAAAIE